MKKTIMIFILSFLVGYCLAQERGVVAKNDTLYFEGGAKCYVPRYNVKVTYYDLTGNTVDISKCKEGIYLVEYISSEFKYVEFYSKRGTTKTKKQAKASRPRQDQS